MDRESWVGFVGLPVGLALTILVLGGGLLLAIDAGWISMFLIGLPLWAHGKHSRLSPEMQRASDLASAEYARETNPTNDTMTNFDSPTGQLWYQNMTMNSNTNQVRRMLEENRRAINGD
jgi:hypothetical protein